MRMWMVDPKLMCNKHLLGEHSEIHMFVGSINKKKNLAGFIKKGLLETASLQSRHDTLAQELVNRGMKHNSVLASFRVTNDGHVDPNKSLEDLKSRCTQCKF